MRKIMTENKFSEMGIGNDIVRALNVLGYAAPTKVQSEVIPHLLAGEDLLVKSQTGSGKTAAYGIPVAEKIDWEERAPQALVLSPTRELASQIGEDIFNIGRFKRLKVETLFGHASFRGQATNLKQRTHVVVATPGRLLDHIDQKTIDLSKIKMVIIDEADEMLNMGFVDQIEDVLRELPEKFELSLFSATFPEEILGLTENYLVNPTEIEVDSPSDVKKRILQQYYRVDKADRMTALKNIMIVENPDTSIIFANQRVTVDEIAEMLSDLGASVETLHGGMEQRDRTRVMQEFKQGYFRYLVATDVAARGLDIADIELIVNFDLPEEAEHYTHRIGRTARGEKKGKAISLVNQFDAPRFEPIEEQQDHQLIEMKMPRATLVQDRLASFKAKQSRQMKIKKTKAVEFKSDIMKLHINAGKKTKMRAGDIVGAITNIAGVTGADVGVISIIDVSTFVEILNGKGAQVLKALQKDPIKGRVRKVSKANETQYEKDLKKQN